MEDLGSEGVEGRLAGGGEAERVGESLRQIGRSKGVEADAGTATLLAKEPC